jgi:hypothetical protein
MSEGDLYQTSTNPYIAIIIPNKVDGKKFKPIPIEYISGDNKEEICIINESLKIDSTGLTNREVVDDFIRKFLSNWKKLKNHEKANNYMYLNAPEIHPDEYASLRKKYLDLEDNYLKK